MDVSEHRQVVKLFIQDVDEALMQFDQSVAALERDGATLTLLDRLARTVHSIKGSAAALGFAEVAEFTHHLESYVKSLKKHEHLPRNEVCKPLLAAKTFIHDHIQSLREGKRSPASGELIIQSMEKVLEPQSFSHVIKLPKAPLAGDIWFMNDDFELELFEMPDQSHDEDHPLPEEPQDPEQFEIRSEILRLTQLAAAVNLNTVLAAQSFAVHETQSQVNSEWSLAGIDTQTIGDKPEQFEAEIPSISESVSQSDPQASGSQESDSLTMYDAADPAVLQEPHVEVVSSQTSTDTDEQSQDDTGEAIHLFEDKIQDNPTLQSETSAQPSHTIDLDSISQNTVGKSCIQVSLKDIDNLLELTEELVTLQNILDEHKPIFEAPLLQKTISRLSKLVAQTQELSMSIKMVRFSSLSDAFSEYTQRQAILFHKKIQPEIVGGNTEIDKSILDELVKPLSLLISNAVEHGIESVDERIEKGKPAAGQVVVSLKMNPKEIIFEVSDDGRGLDLPQIRKKAIACGLMARLDRVSDDHIRSFIFHPGFTTRNSANEEEENQGLGLHQLSTFIHKNKGRIEFESIRDHGSVFRIILPQSVSVIEAFVVRVGSERFVIPKNQITESVTSHEAQVDLIQGHHQLLNVRGTSVPLIHLSTILRRPSVALNGESQFHGVALISEEDNSRPFAVIVDDIVCQKKIVIKPLGLELQKLRGLAGAAILGDGKPSIILNLQELIATYRIERVEKIEKKYA